MFRYLLVTDWKDLSRMLAYSQSLILEDASYLQMLVECSYQNCCYLLKHPDINFNTTLLNDLSQMLRSLLLMANECHLEMNFGFQSYYCWAAEACCLEERYYYKAVHSLCYLHAQNSCSIRHYLIKQGTYLEIL